MHTKRFKTKKSKRFDKSKIRIIYSKSIVDGYQTSRLNGKNLVLGSNNVLEKEINEG